MTMIQTYFSNIRQQILNCLEEANEEILVAIYWFTNIDLFNKLCDKLSIGIKVELIIYNDYTNNRNGGLEFQKFIDLGGKFYFSECDKPMHNKFCVIDNKLLINGSYNWTYYAESKNHENIVIIRDTETINKFHKEFNTIKLLLQSIKTIEKISIHEIEEFNSLSSREYLFNDILLEALETNNPDKKEDAFKLIPKSINSQKARLTSESTLEKKVISTIGIFTHGDNFLKIINKGSLTPIIESQTITTMFEDQTKMDIKIYYGENDIASQNVFHEEFKIYNIPPLKKSEAKIKCIFSIDMYGFLTMHFILINQDIELLSKKIKIIFLLE